MKKKFKITATILLIAAGILSLTVSIVLNAPEKPQPRPIANIQNFPLQAVVSMGHEEFAWTLVAIQSLAATINAWTLKNSSNIDPQEQKRVFAKFDEALIGLAPLAQVSLGMREVFTFPASLLAFEFNDIDRAINVARLGANDKRLEVDLILSVAFLTHIFKGDLKAAAEDYQRVSAQFPNATWLQDSVRLLKQGIDPSKRAGKDKTILCKMLANAFPLAKKKLVQRNLCTPKQIGEGSANE